MNMPQRPAASGYVHADYAASFAEASTPRELPHSGGWFLERTIPGSTFLDGMGCYPLFACRNWAGLPSDVELLSDHLISLTLVADPFGHFSESDLRRSFHVVRLYKEHFVIDLERWHERLLPRRHRRNLSASLSRVRVQPCPHPQHLSREWAHLYGQLVVRHHITGVAAFSSASLAKQLAVPGLVMFKALVDDELVGLHLWYMHGDVAYGHLGATSQRGYQVMAAYALYWHAIQYLRGQVHWLDLGGVAGASEGRTDDGLRLFKVGWSTDVRWAYLCGRIFQPERYTALVSQRGDATSAYFPAYRAGEFVSHDVNTGTATTTLC